MIQNNVNLEKVGISSSNLEQERRGCSLRFWTRASEQPKLLKIFVLDFRSASTNIEF